MNPEQKKIVAEMFAALEKQFGSSRDARCTESYSRTFFEILEKQPRYACMDCRSEAAHCREHLNPESHAPCYGNWKELGPLTRLNMAIGVWHRRTFSDARVTGNGPVAVLHSGWAYGTFKSAPSVSNQ